MTGGPLSSSTRALAADVAARKTVPASYVVYKDGSNYYAESLVGGNDATPGTNALTAAQFAFDNLSAGRTWKERVVFKGDINFTSASPVLLVPSYSVLDIQGRLKYNSDIPAEGAFIRNSDFSGGNTNIEVFGGGAIDGTTGTSVTGHGRGHAIEFRKVTNFLLFGMTFQNLSGMCLRNGLTNSANTGNSYGTIAGCRVTDGSTSGFVDFLGDSSKISVIGNEVNLWDTSITVYDGVEILIAHNYLAQRAPGVEITPQGAADVCRDITIEDNIIRPSVTKGIWLHQLSAGAAGTISRVDMILNKIISPPQTGIEIHVFNTGLDKIRALYNTIISPGAQGVFCTNDSTASVLSDSDFIGNKIFSPVQEAMRFVGIQDSIIAHNRVEASTGAGIHVLRLDATTISKYLQINHNTVKNSTGASGFGINEDTSCDFNEIIGNILVGNAQVGVVKSGANTRVKFNQGYVSENRGITNIADGGNINHGLATTPASARATASVSGEFASITAKSSTTLTVAIKKHDGTAGTTQDIYWDAEL